MAESEVKFVSGTIRKVVSYKAETNWAFLSVSGKTLESVIGYVLCVPFEGMKVEAQGGHERHPKFGKQFTATEIQLKPPTDKSKLAAYIQHIAPALSYDEAWKAAEFGKDLGGEELVPGIDPEKARRLQGVWRDRDLDPVGIALLRGIGYSTPQAIQIARYFRDKAENITAAVHKNPYCILNADIAFRYVDDASLRLGWGHSSPERITAGLNEGARLWSNDGHTICSRGELRATTVDLLKCDQYQVDALIDHAVEEGLLSFRGDLGDEPRYQMPRLFTAENSIAYDVNRLSKPRPVGEYIPNYDQVEEATGFKPDPEQVRAIHTTFEVGLSILTGGPGCGKTAITRALCKLFPGEVKLIAPTGMAAKRLSEATGRTATTIHRFLGGALENERWHFAYHRANQVDLEDALIVVDEASMLDSEIGSALLQALPSTCTVVLVGDANQLPSVGPGQVLADLISYGVVTTELKHIHRQGIGSPIPYVAREIIEGRVPEIGTVGQVRMIETQRDDFAAVVYGVVKGMISAGVSGDDVRVLAPMKMGAFGVDMMNTNLQRLWNAAGLLREGVGNGTYFKDHFGAEVGEMLYPGDRVLMTRNDHEKQVYNGDICLVLDCGHEGTKKVPWIEVQTDDGTAIKYKGKKFVAGFRLAYATSVHKAQGSQFKHALVVLVKAHRRMLQRRLVYTAVTRAQQTLTVVGHFEAVRMACADAGGITTRYTGLKELLASGAYKENLGITDQDSEEDQSSDDVRLERCLEVA